MHLLLKAGKVDLNYLAQLTNAPALVDSTEGPNKGLLLKDDDGKLLVIDRKTRNLVAFDKKGITPDLAAKHNGHRTVFQHLAERYLSDDYAPEKVAERCGISAKRIKAIAADLARVAFEEAFELDQPWTDFRGNKHDKMIGRPVSFHAMRGVSAHSNGFQTVSYTHLRAHET